jgi:hypothetical protein
MLKKRLANVDELDLKIVIERVRKLDGMQLEKLYCDLCAVMKRLRIKNRSELMRRQIYHHIQKKKYGDIGRKYKNQILRLSRDIGIKAKNINKVAPAEGTVLKRVWKGKSYIVEHKEGIYYLEGHAFKSLSAVAKHITGHERSGPAFFGLKKKG